MNIQRLVQENGVRPAQHFRAVIYMCMCYLTHALRYSWNVYRKWVWSILGQRL